MTSLHSLVDGLRIKNKCLQREGVTIRPQYINHIVYVLQAGGGVFLKKEYYGSNFVEYKLQLKIAPNSYHVFGVLVFTKGFYAKQLLLMFSESRHQVHSSLLSQVSHPIPNFQLYAPGRINVAMSWVWYIPDSWVPEYACQNHLGPLPNSLFIGVHEGVPQQLEEHIPVWKPDAVSSHDMQNDICRGTKPSS